MTDFNKITNYNLSDAQLEERIIAWICVAGKKASTISNALEKLYKQANWSWKSPFDLFKDLSETEIRNRLWEAGIGCQSTKSKALKQISNSGVDLKNCTVDDLVSIHGIGPKTARCFILHTRKDAQVAGLDTHVLAFLRDLGYEVPKSTPTGKKYLEIEKLFLNIVKKTNRNVADLDLLIWRVYSQHSHLKRKLLNYFKKRK
jgi:thermostable 8-oxoguanine DNA glycosylase